ncbi:Bug family tripartite tricarboxylate transporter substrate binding protein [Polynucleobacter kasalickyi]|uniref:Tripartite-type tricarboxylate transporter, receptor component TctC n=1 Tax=Polynucleobacter kasalickyi TaxID=1938817 RepID=A0A1W2C8C3_9BURK|nr:tripartite tricarboxylate transporter substrate binding protein [Polynucleobacter kasalickyi]SMC81400.1 Tripartite-type tricarboxylate transporter, receptor component TctC [Polynucleobacter kasalickyi]
MQFSKFSFLKSAVAMSLISLSTMTLAQTYPTKPVHFVVAFTAGSGTDIIARAVGDVMSGSLGQPIIIDNKPGAGGTIAASQVAKSDPDGYNLLVHSAGHALNPFIYPSLNYDTLKDLTGVIPLAALPNVLVVSPNKPWKTVADLIAATKEKPGELNYASAGVGSATHMNAEKFNLYAGIKATHVPYKGTPEAISDVIGGRADWYFAPLSSALPLIQGGKLKALAVSTPKRTSALPNVPTTVEAGVPNSDYVFWVGLIAPSATSPAIIKKLNDEVLKTLNNQEVKDRFAKLGAEPLPMSPEAFNTFIKAEMEVASKISKAANLKN